MREAFGEDAFINELDAKRLPFFFERYANHMKAVDFAKNKLKEIH